MVYEAVAPDGTRVAIKLLLPEHGARKDIAERFLPHALGARLRRKEELRDRPAEMDEGDESPRDRHRPLGVEHALEHRGVGLGEHAANVLWQAAPGRACLMQPAMAQTVGPVTQHFLCHVPERGQLARGQNEVL